MQKTTTLKKISPKKPLTKGYLALLVIVLSVAAIWAAKFTLILLRPKSFETALARTKGDPNAQVQITEYLDFQCPACAKGSLFLSKMISDNPGQIFLQVKYYPLENMHKHAIRSARYAECAARQGKFWPFHDLLFAQQARWKELINPEPAFQQIAMDTQLDFNWLNQCLSDDGVRETIMKEKKEGAASGISSTPTYFINGKMVVGPKLLEEELKKHFGGSTN